MLRPLSSLISLLLAASPASAQAPAAASLTRIGAAAAVAGKVLARAPGTQVGRVVGSGKPIFLNDHVTTDAAGRLQVMLLDETVFTLGPNSDMVLDQYVYDPDTHEGTMAASISKGAFRFVSGRMSHESGKNMKVNMPSGTMGIRGTIAGGITDGKTSDVVLLGPGVNNNAGEPPGSIVVTGNGHEVIIETPGFGTHLEPNQPPPPPTEMQETVKAITGSVASNPKGGGQGGTQTAGNSTDPNQGPSNATSASGQETASGGANANTTADNSNANPDSDTNLVNNATQDINNVDTVTTFEQLAQGLNTGQDYYSMSGTYSCSGGTCGTGTTGTMSVSLAVDWEARTYGAQGSFSHITLDSSGSFTGDDVAILSHSFPSTTGPATLPFSSFGSATNGGDFSNSGVKLLNADGVIAHDASADIHYTSSNASETARGTATGGRQTLPPQ
jgi:hypothetical protein